jgi:YebC/PmpR family DNA-binding regulatory protein
MAGHSKWAQIKRSKGALDVKRGKIFGKLSRALTVAARQGGGDLQFNPRLRSIVLTAKAAHMPNDNIDRAIKKGAGTGPDAANFEEILYEGYGASGVALLLEVVTDNKNRAAAEIRNVFTKHHGNMAAAGSVAWMFNRKGIIAMEAGKTTEDQLMDWTLDAGAEDITQTDDQFEIQTPPDRMDKVLDALKQNGITPTSAKLTYLPQTTIDVNVEEDARKILDLVEALEELDDVQNVHVNFDIPDRVMEKLEA